MCPTGHHQSTGRSLAENVLSVPPEEFVFLYVSCVEKEYLLCNNMQKVGEFFFLSMLLVQALTCVSDLNLQSPSVQVVLRLMVFCETAFIK